MREVKESKLDGANDVITSRPHYTEFMYRPELTGWTPSRVRGALIGADGGNLMPLADLIETMLEDDRIDGVLQTRTHGLLGLDVTFTGGNDEAIKELRGTSKEPGDWSRMCNESEMVKLLKWGISMGIGLAQLIPLPRVINQPQRYKIQTWSPRWLQYQWKPMSGTHWFVMTEQGRVPIYPGDGQWIMFMPYGERRPWAEGKWRSLAFPWMLKRYSLEDRANFSQVLGSPIWLGKAGPGSSEKQRTKFLNQLVSLGKAGKIVLPDGWNMEMVEAASKSWEIFTEQVSWADKAITIVLAGQLVTTEGNSGFSTGNVHDNIKDDLLRFDAQVFAECIREQVLCEWARTNWGYPEYAPYPQWATEKPQDGSEKAGMLSAVAAAVTALDGALAPHGFRTNASAIAQEYGLPIEAIKPTAPSPKTPEAQQ